MSEIPTHERARLLCPKCALAVFIPAHVDE
jgi:ribosomal protein S27AE